MKKLSILIIALMTLVCALPAWATVTVETSRVQYTCNGTQTTYAYPFEILEDDDLDVITTSSAGVESTLVLNTDYTVTSAGTVTGGNVVLTAGSKCASGYYLTITRDIEITQETDYVDGASFSAESLENALDKNILVIQQLDKKLDRAPLLPQSTALSSVTLSEPAAGEYLRWNTGGTGIESTASVSTTGTYTASGTGGTARTVDAKLGDVINVKDYGAKCDGVTDDTTPIQYALNVGGRVQIPSNSTCVFYNLTITVAGTTLEGAGWGSVLQSSLAATGNTATAILVQANNVTLRDFKLTYATIPTALAAAGGWVVQNNGIGIGVNPTVADTYYSNVTIDNVYVLGGKTHGICVGRSVNTVVKNCRVENVWGTGVWGTHTKDTQIIHNYITETEDAGIDMTANGTDPAGTGVAPWVSENILIEGNILYRNAAGIGCHGPYGCIIKGNIIDTTYSSPIVAALDAAGGHTTPQNVTITDNIIIDPWKLYGAGETHANDIVTTSGGVHAAIEAWVDGNLIITGNSIYDVSSLTTSYVGIWAGGDSATATPTTNVTMTGNDLYVDTAYGVVIGSYADATGVDQVDNLTMTGNTLVISSGNGTMALYLNGVMQGTVSGNTFDCGGQTLSDPRGRFVVANYSENVMISGNRVKNATGNEYSNAVGSSEIVLKDNLGLTTYTAGWYASQTNFEDDTSAINTVNKYAGKVVWDTTGAQFVFCKLATAAGHWYLMDGTDTYTPTH